MQALARTVADYLRTGSTRTRSDLRLCTDSVVPGEARHAQLVLVVSVGNVRLTCANAFAGVGRSNGRLPTLLPRICHARSRHRSGLVRVALIIVEHRFPVLTAMEDADDVDHDVRRTTRRARRRRGCVFLDVVVRMPGRTSSRARPANREHAGCRRRGRGAPTTKRLSDRQPTPPRGDPVVELVELSVRLRGCS